MSQNLIDKFNIGDQVTITSKLLIDALRLTDTTGEIVSRASDLGLPLSGSADYRVLCSTSEGPKKYHFGAHELVPNI